MPLSVRIAKRLIDLFVSFTALVVLSPLLLIVAIAIKLDSPGPVLYKQRRVRRCWTNSFTERCIPTELDTFEVYKFRTMVNNAEQITGAVNASEDDNRVTRIGKFLRPTRIDEIPNLLNVLIGDMSIVGPRADRIEIFNDVEDDFPYVWERTKFVKPGITGDAQIHLRSNGSLNGNIEFAQALPDSDTDKPINSFRYKLYYDFAYTMKLTKFWSFLVTDLTIMFKTPYVMFIRKNTI